MWNFIKSLFNEDVKNIIPKKSKTIIDIHPDFLDWKVRDVLYCENHTYFRYDYISVSDKFIEVKDMYGELHYFNYKDVRYNESLLKRNQRSIHNESTEFYELLKKSYDEEIIRHLKEKNL